MLRDRNRHYIKPGWFVRSVQQAMPAAKLYDTGMMEFRGTHLYSSTFRFKDVDFLSGAEADQKDFFKRYSGTLHGLDCHSGSYKITIFNRNSAYRKGLGFTPLKTNFEDDYNIFRQEYNTTRQINRAKAGGIIQERFITMTTERKNATLAEEEFTRFAKDFTSNLRAIESDVSRLSANDRMELLYDFYRPGIERYFSFDFAHALERHSTWKDYICPEYMKFRESYFEMGNGKLGRIIFLRDWGVTMRPDIISKIMGFRINMMVSVDLIPLSPETTSRYMDDVEMAAEANLYRWEERNVSKNRRFALPPMRIRKEQKIIDTYNEDVNERDQRLFLSNVLIALQADSMEELELNTESIKNAANVCGGQVQILYCQQMEGLNTILPYGPRYIQNLREVTTENASVMMPFNSVIINHESGIPYGVHFETKQELMIDRRKLANGNEWVLGVPGGGKSMLNKLLGIYEVLLTPGDLIFIDPHGEYVELTHALHGQVVTLGGSSGDIINAMDMNQGYGNGDDLKRKMELLVAMFHAALGPEFTKSMEAIVMRCCYKVYQAYIAGGYGSAPPTLRELQAEVRAQPEAVAQSLALLMEPMMIGSMSCFTGYTNVNIYSRITCFDISKMDQSVWDAGMTVILDAIQNRLVTNHNIDKPTYIKIDEAGRFLNDSYLSYLFERFYSESRKYGGYITGIVQNVNKLLHTEAGRNMLSNSEIVVMFRQSPQDAKDLVELYNLTEKEEDLMIGVEPGCGLIKCGNQYISLDSRIEKGYIYELANTKPKHDF